VEAGQQPRYLDVLAVLFGLVLLILFALVAFLALFAIRL
jgi:hypothetical protein